jgi:uncharacterized protein (DUF1778 family)
MSENSRSERLELRLETEEKIAFRNAANVSGIPLSSWIRERLRRAAIQDLQNVGQVPEFLKNRKIGDE